MKSITTNKTRVLGEIRKNRSQHRKIFEEAIEGYRKQMIEELEARIYALKAGRSVEHHFRFVVPEDHTKDYDRVIQMLEMEVNEEIELDERSFACYVMDDWDWRRDFISNATSYGSVAAAACA